MSSSGEIKKLLKIKTFVPFANINEEIVDAGGLFKFYFIQDLNQQKAQVYFKPVRIHSIIKNGINISFECLMKTCPACKQARNDQKLQFKSRYLYNISSSNDNRLLILDCGPNLHSKISEMIKIYKSDNTDIFNNPKVSFILGEKDWGLTKEYVFSNKETLDHEFPNNVKAMLSSPFINYEKKYLILSSQEILDII
jgi:hypothetical protein